ncbi:hypothetical protein F4604DRAFT_1736013 [Suillus subluteus]|nr:hypothetical protein F4604DRAFT_1736013 [Suillus subluteus]
MRRAYRVACVSGQCWRTMVWVLLMFHCLNYDPLIVYIIHTIAMHYAICIMSTFSARPCRDPQKSMHYNIYAMLRYAI